MQGAGVKQTRSVCSPRARAAAAGRSRCVFAKQIRGFSAQSLSPEQMRCLSNLSLPCAASTEPPPYRGESNSVQGAGVKKTPQQRRVGRAFPTAAQAENPSRNSGSDWDVVSGWRLKWKVHPRIRAQNGTCFPDACSSGNCNPEFALRMGHTFRFTCRLEKPARSPSQNWVEESQNAIAGGQYDCRR